jgi:hypothetical protein
MIQNAPFEDRAVRVLTRCHAAVGPRRRAKHAGSSGEVLAGLTPHRGLDRFGSVSKYSHFQSVEGG